MGAEGEADDLRSKLERRNEMISNDCRWTAVHGLSQCHLSQQDMEKFLVVTDDSRRNWVSQKTEGKVCEQGADTTAGGCAGDFWAYCTSQDLGSHFGNALQG